MARPWTVVLLLMVAAGLWSGPEAVRAAARQACEVGQQRSGCRIHTGLCVCGIGCRSEYQYADKEECTSAIKGRRNQCGETPCLHGGACSQTTMDPGYKCRCEGTGYYGSRCQHECPSPSPGAAVGAGTRPLPLPCILI